MRQYYQVAIDSFGQSYLDAQRRLIALGERALPFLHNELEEATPPTRLIIQVLLQWIEGNTAFQACLDFFDETERETAPTVQGAPPPEWVGGMLFRRFGDDVSLLLGTYLFKLERIWPYWKTVGVILYLGKCNSESSVDALIEFTNITPSDLYRELTVDSLVALGNKNTIQKLEANLTNSAAAQNAFQQALDQIRGKLNA